MYSALLVVGTFAAPSAAAPSSYLFQPGYLADGNDLGELFFDIADAKKYCDAEKTCQGFTFKETDEPTQKLSVRFKSNAAVTYDSSWLSYTKSATPTPYFYQAGFLGDGKELHAAQMTLAEAQAWCDKSVKCKGFSTDKPKLPTDALYVRFSDSNVVTYDGGWMTYTKVPKSAASAAYTYHPGYLGDGKALHEAFMTAENAKKYCDANAKCAGFTVDKQPAEPTMEMFVRFKSSPVVSYDQSFGSYVKDTVKSEL